MATPATPLAGQDADVNALLSQQSSELERLRADLVALSSRVPVPAQTQTQPPSFFDNPEAAVKQEITQAVAPLALMTLQANAQLARNAAERDPRLRAVFAKYGAEVDALMEKESPIARANQAMWMNAAKIVLADHFDDIQKAAQSGADFFVEGGTPGTPTAKPKSTEPEPLDADQQRMLKLFGMTEDEFRKSMSGVTVMGKAAA